VAGKVSHPKVFIVEDDEAFLVSISALLTKAGYEVSSSTSSTDPRLQQWFAQADLVVLDLELPDRDGFEVLAAIRESAETATMPVLMLTAHDPMRYRLKGLAMGADDYLLKPPNRDELLLRIAGLLRRYGGSPRAGEDKTRVVVDSPKGGCRFVDARDITHISAAHNYCHVHTYDDARLASTGIGDIAKQLGDRFVRAHRSFLVNPNKVRAARWLSPSTYVLEMDTAQETLITVSRPHRSAVRNALGIADTPFSPES